MNTLRTSILSLALATGLACAQENPAPAPGDAPAAKPHSEMEKWITATDTQWQEAFKKGVTDVQEAELNKAKLQYLTLLEEGIKKASSAGDLKGAVALRDEQKRFGDTQFFPEQDDAADVASVKQIRAVIRAQMAKVNADHATRAKGLHAKYDQMLAQTQTQLTQRQRLDDALLVQAKREEVTATWLAGAPIAVAPAAVVEQPKPPVTTPVKPLVSVPFGARLAENMHIHASGNNGCIITINGKEIGRVMRDKPSTFTHRMREGDVIAVKLTDRFDINSFWMSCIASSGEFLFETSEQWMCYVPKDMVKWWNINDVEKQQAVRFAPDRQQYVGTVKMSAAQIPLYNGTQPIRSDLSDGTRTAWIYYVVTKADLVLKKDRGNAETASTAKPDPAAPIIPVREDSGTAAVKALVAGSRWQWFDTPDFSGKAYWFEIYKDGTARTSWATGHTWDIIPPNILHIYQPGDNRHIYLDIDVAKRTGRKNAERDKGNNSVRFEKRISGPAVNAKKKN